jgi:hypothetical protein
MAEQRHVQYNGQKDFNKDRRKWEREGWYVANVSEVKQPVGIKRLAVLSVGALVVKPKPQLYVTYEKPER